MGRTAGFTFTETMEGPVAPGAGDYRQAEARGKQNGESLRFTLSVTTHDLDAFIRDPAHEATLQGTVQCERFGGVRPIDPGTFNLFIEDEQGYKQMRYSFTFRGAAGQQYLFEGFKDVRNDYVIDVWKDTTTLFTTVREVSSPDRPVILTGVLYIRPMDLLSQLLSMRGVNARTPIDHAKALVRFNLFFTERILNEYWPMTLRRRKQPGTARD